MFTIDLGIKSVEDVRLYGSIKPTDERDFVPAKSLLFGEMVKRSVTEHYQSDLYHDVRWLDTNLKATTEPQTFGWVTRQWGTHIGFLTDSAAVYWGWRGCLDGRDPYRAFVITLWNDSTNEEVWSSGTWHATFVEVGK